jgi:protein-S-isoprenylcysteine O-methyltransferase Ste14
MTQKAAIRILLQFFLAFLVMFLAWGFDDLGGFLQHPARLGLLAVGVLSLILIFALRLDPEVFRKGTRPVGRQRWVLPVLMVIGLGLIFFLPYADRRGFLVFRDGDGLRYAGLLLYATGNGLAFAALRSLGKQYSGYVTLQEDHRLVQTGLYSVIRHPIYLRALLVAVGIPLIFRSWLWIALLLLIIPFVATRIRQEERLLADQFGAEFEDYRRRTWRLIPYLY